MLDPKQSFRGRWHEDWHQTPPESGQCRHGRDELRAAMVLTSRSPADLSAHRFPPENALPRGEHGQQCAGGPSVVLSIMCLSLHLTPPTHGLSQCPCSAWYNGVMPSASLAFGLRGHFSNRSRPTVSSSLAIIIRSSSSASGGQNSKTSS